MFAWEMLMHDTFLTWFDALYARHTEQLQFAEIRRALQALSTLYVHQREKVAAHQALEGRGKRAAFALFYAPIHYLTVRQVAESLGLSGRAPRRIIDVGCGTGAGGAAVAAHREDHVVGLDINTWALDEARWSWQHLGLSHQIVRGDASRLASLLGAPASRSRVAALPRPAMPCTIVLAYVVNELAAEAQDALLQTLSTAARNGHEILLLEPIARRISPWWERWSTALCKVGGRADEWKLNLAMPEKLRLLDKASGMRHTHVKVRTLYVPATA
jgi:SAM-dependent methyltransferase